MKFLVSALILTLSLSVIFGVSVISPKAAAEPSSVRVSPFQLEKAIRERIDRVPEFRFLRSEAKAMGIDVYLFGGTAAGFAHYVRWDLQRESGETRFEKSRFDYDMTNIYRSTQDLDIVIDGTAAQAEHLANRLKVVYPQFQGEKDQWEVRLLRSSVGDKEALLGNPDFLHQHTDSNSTGLVKLTSISKDDPIVRDLRDWKSSLPHFLVDVAEGKIRFYFSALHETTNRFKQGMNPPIFSVVRYFTKAFQYELDSRPEDLAVLQRLIDRFDPKSPEFGYVRRWLEKNAPKLVRHAVNIEYAWNTLESNGLRKKLIAFSGDSTAVDSLANWLDREPLRGFPVGAGKGETARELGLSVLAHETNDFLAYESVSRSLKGEVNALISREGGPQEAAALGDGFYTRVGREGAIGTGLTVRFRLSPEARRGKDFELFEWKDEKYVVVHNRNAIRVIAEDLHMSLVEYLDRFSKVEKADLGLVIRFRRRMANQWPQMPQDEKRAVLTLISDRIARLKTHHAKMDPTVVEWFSLSISKEHPELLASLTKEVGDGWESARKTLSAVLRATDVSLEGFKALDVLLEQNRRAQKSEPEIFKTIDHPYAANWQRHPLFEKHLEEAVFSNGTNAEVFSNFDYAIAQTADERMWREMIDRAPSWVFLGYLPDILHIEPLRSSAMRERVIEIFIESPFNNVIKPKAVPRLVLDLAFDRKSPVKSSLISYVTKNFRVENTERVVALLNRPDYQAHPDYQSWISLFPKARRERVFPRLSRTPPRCEVLFIP